MKVQLFGWQIETPEDETGVIPTPVTQQPDDGAITVQSPTMGIYVEMDATYRSELDLLHKYRQMAIQPEVENAINDIVDDAICHDEDDGTIVKINLDRLNQPDEVKDAIREAFHQVTNLLNFNKFGDEIFRKWYIDGRVHYQVLIDNDKPQEGIKELRYIDARKIKKIREITKGKDPHTGIEVITGQEEYYIYNDKLMMNNPNSGNPMVQAAIAEGGTRLSDDSVVQCTSGVYDPIKATVLSYLHKAIRPVNQLRFVEDAVVIYRVTRAPERRVFYIDTSGLNKQKAEQYMKNIMTNFRNKLTYDPTTGQIKDDRRHIAMLEDFWMARNGEGKGTEITTLPAGQNLGQMEDVLYFQKALYKALNIPTSRIENPQGLFNIGQPGAISRDEIKFHKHVIRLRAKFSALFDEVMMRQCVLTKVCTKEEWKQFAQDVYYDFADDNNFAEMKDCELLTVRTQALAQVQPYMGVLFSKYWVQKNILRLEDDEIKEMEEQMAEERQEAELEGHPPLAGFPPVVPPGAPPAIDQEGPMSPDNTDDQQVGKPKPPPDNLDKQAKGFLSR